MGQNPSTGANRFAASQEIPCIFATRRFTTAFTNVRHLTHTEPARSSPYHYILTQYWVRWSKRSILILSSDLRLGYSSVLFPSSFPSKILTSVHAAWLTQFIPHNFITHTIMGEKYKSLSYSLCSFLHYGLTSSLLGPNVLLNILFPSTLNLRSSLNVSDQVSVPYKTTGKIIVLHTFISKFLDCKLEDKGFCTEWQQASPEINLLLIFSSIEFWSVSCSQIFELFHPFKGIITNFHTVNFSYIPISWHYHVLSFITIYFQSNLLTAQ